MYEDLSFVCLQHKNVCIAVNYFVFVNDIIGCFVIQIRELHTFNFLHKFNQIFHVIKFEQYNVISLYSKLDEAHCISGKKMEE